jgi:hypothetical protein
MQEEELSGSIRNDLLERVRALESGDSPGSLSELAYRRAREALSAALEEARSIRLQALADTRAMRERAFGALAEDLQNMRRNTEAETANLIRTAEIEAERIRDEVQGQAEETIAGAERESAMMRAEASALRTTAEERAREVENLEAEFNALIERLNERLGLNEKPSGGWLRRLFGRK